MWVGLLANPFAGRTKKINPQILCEAGQMGGGPAGVYFGAFAPDCRVNLDK